MGFVLILLNWYQMCLNHIYCYLFMIYDICLDNKCYNCIYYVKSKYLLVFIRDTVFIEVVFIYLKCNLIVFIEICIYSYILHWIYFSFVQYMCYKIY